MFNGITGRSYAAMKILAEREELYGQRICDESADIPRGSVYNQLRSLELLGLVSVREEQGGRIRGVPRRYYRLNDHGRAVLQLLNKIDAELIKAARRRR